MYILGLSFFYHDSAAALIKDGEVVAAIQEERWSRKKNDESFPENAINFCLAEANITIDQIDYVVFYEKPFTKFERLWWTILSTYPKSWRLFKEAMVVWFGEKLWIKSLIKDKLNYKKEVLFVEHHLSHAAASYLCSPYNEAAILTVDGIGEWTSTTIGKAKENKIEIIKEIHYPHSLGLLYSAFTAFLGFKVNEGEYKVMGMAPYGKPIYVDKVKKLVNLHKDGSYSLNMDYFCFHYTPDTTYNKKFEELFDVPPRPSTMKFYTKNIRYSDYFDDELDKKDPEKYEKECELNQKYADIAASLQKVTEEILINLAKAAKKETNLNKLCFGGGVALNSVANTKILNEAGFDELYIHPAAGDAGGAMGCALYVYYTLLGNKKKFVLTSSYFGKDFIKSNDAEKFISFLKEKNVKVETFDNDEKCHKEVVKMLIDGWVVGWYNGKTEWGPRALGNRSIIADARRDDMKKRVNQAIKFREPFRPFAPSMLSEVVEDFLVLPDAQKHYPAKFMLYVVPVKEGIREVLPAITHVNGTARLQAVRREDNPKYYDMIKEFEKETGVGVILNTSFNLKGEPIVNSPYDAFNTFSSCEMEALVIGNNIIKKNQNYHLIDKQDGNEREKNLEVNKVFKEILKQYKK